MRARLHDPAGVEDHDPVRVADGREAVRDHDGRPAAHQERERVLHGRLRRAVEGRRRLVEHEHRRVLEQRTRDGDALALPAGELDAALADRRRVAVRQRRDEAVRVGGAGGGLDLGVRRVQPAVADVVGQRGAEELHVLRDDGDGRADTLDRQRPQVVAVERDRARRAAGHGRIGVVEAGQEREQRRLAGPGRPDERDRLAGLDAERDVVQDRPARRAVERRRAVGERDVLEGDGPADGRRQRHGVRRVGDLGDGVEQLEQALACAGGRVERRVQPRPAADRPRDVERVHDERDEVAGRQALGEDLAPAEPEDADEARQEQERDDVPEDGRHDGAPPRRLEQALDGDPVAARLVRLAPERLHDAHGPDGLLGDGRRVGEAVLDLARQVADGHADPARRKRDEGHDGDDAEREPPVEHHHEHGRADERQREREHLLEVVRDGGLHLRDVVGEPGRDLAGPRLGEKAQPEPVQVRVEALPKVRHDALAGPVQPVPADRAEHRLKREQAEQAQREAVQQRAVGLREHGVEQPFEPERHDEPDRRRDEQQRDGPAEAHAVRPREDDEAAQRDAERRAGTVRQFCGFHRGATRSGQVGVRECPMRDPSPRRGSSQAHSLLCPPIRIARLPVRIVGLHGSGSAGPGGRGILRGGHSVLCPYVGPARTSVSRCLPLRCRS